MHGAGPALRCEDVVTVEDGTAGEMDEPFVDTDDVADVAVAVLTENGHAGRVYELTGPSADVRFATIADPSPPEAEAAAALSLWRPRRATGSPPPAPRRR